MLWKPQLNNNFAEEESTGARSAPMQSAPLPVSTCRAQRTAPTRHMFASCILATYIHMYEFEGESLEFGLREEPQPCISLRLRGCPAKEVIEVGKQSCVALLMKP